MLRRVPGLLATVLISEVTLVFEAITEVTEDVAEAEAGVMTVEIEVANLREIIGIDETIEARPHHSVMIEAETDGAVRSIEVAEHHLLRAEAGHRITPHGIVEMARQA
jgi:hypothetical protein